ncbi:MAG TPA: hypothetical protein VGM39_24285 [Kofleriaceae bacterium]|jgi:hypothetical protein
MKYAVAVVIALSFAIADAGPKSSFGPMQYELPAGWTATQPKDPRDALTLTKVDNAKKTFVLAKIYPLAASSGSQDADFKNAWKIIVEPSFSNVAAPQATTGPEQQGWKAVAGISTGTYNNANAQILLITLVGHGKQANILIVTNDYAGFGEGIGQLVGSFDMSGFKDGATTLVTATPAPSGTRTTKFDDGWTSTAEANWVRVARSEGTVYLHYPVALDDSSRRDIPNYFWQQLVAPRYQLTNVAVSTYSATNFPYYYVTANGVEKTSNRKVFVALRIVVNNGTAFPIEVVTTSQAALTQLFPDQDKLAAISGANRFGVSADIVGSWGGANSASVNMYSTVTGGYAGMDTASISDEITFGPNNAFTHVSKGGVGKAGAGMKTSQETSKGTYSINGWEITVKLSTGKTTVYTASYEMARGGEILHLQDKQYSGMAYAVMRSR